MQVAALVAYGVYQGLSGGADVWLSLLDVGLATLSLGLWTALLGDFLRGVAVADTSRRLRVFRFVFPWLTALRAAMWLFTSLAILGGAGDTANPIAVLALFLVWGGGIVAGLAVYVVSSVLFVRPDLGGRARLVTWLNVSAALSVALTVMNVWPPTGFVPPPSLREQVIWGVQGVLDVGATLLALRAVQLAPRAGQAGEH
ncbi:hypothetical protein DKM44_10030 [Deinococcus irradiatisoli]|uniref:Uncharacterized protein n=1 Tax=Deinococcus irradiatisoli TaxID=2202254 RepID=A0A2Z3JJL4_9DEIO|nr:hypothetical protein DKM44_10030 [Deinococcus irradiatisoli]